MFALSGKAQNADVGRFVGILITAEVVYFKVFMFPRKHRALPETTGRGHGQLVVSDEGEFTNCAARTKKVK